MRIVDFGISLGWPYGKFKPLGSLTRKLTKHKSWELEHYYLGSVLINLELRLTVYEDHAGLSTTVGFLGYSIHFAVYDTRHWDHRKDCYN